MAWARIRTSGLFPSLPLIGEPSRSQLFSGFDGHRGWWRGCLLVMRFTLDSVYRASVSPHSSLPNPEETAEQRVLEARCNQRAHAGIAEGFPPERCLRSRKLPVL